MSGPERYATISFTVVDALGSVELRRAQLGLIVQDLIDHWAALDSDRQRLELSAADRQLLTDGCAQVAEILDVLCPNWRTAPAEWLREFAQVRVTPQPPPLYDPTPGTRAEA